MSVHRESKTYDVIVAGGGISGICAAIAAARNGARTAIVQNRPMFGGNASSEIRMHIVGASAHGSKPNMSETGILEEILLENKRRNPTASFSVFDSILWEKIRFQENLDSYLNTNADEVIMDGNRIQSILCHQSTTETEFVLNASIFIDATGHGTLGAMAGAACRIGSESRDEFHEPTAPQEKNSDCMGSSLMFIAKNCGEPIPFEKPDWAYTFTEHDLRFRPHNTGITSHADGGEILSENTDGLRLPGFSNNDSGYWWIELGGQYQDIIRDGETIRDELLKCVYGVWDHLKNAGDHGVENYALDWVGIIPGYRESRRLEGDYILTEQDIRENRVFDDAVAYGGWAMDVHVREGIFAFHTYPSKVYNFEGCYSIPYRCYYSRSVENLMMAGRNISCSKMAFGSTRVMGTCAVGGQAAGTAAALAVFHGCSPKKVGTDYIRKLQQLLLKDDCYIPCQSNRDPLDLARTCRVTSNGFLPSCPPEQVINGVARTVGDASNCWESLDLSQGPAVIVLEFLRTVRLNQLRLTFDPDLSREIMPSITRTVLDRQVKGLPPQLVRDYAVTFFLEGKPVKTLDITGNGQRLNIHNLPEICCDTMELQVFAAHGYPRARVFEIRAY